MSENNGRNGGLSRRDLTKLAALGIGVGALVALPGGASAKKKKRAGGMRVIARGLQFPEGPVAMADGSVLVTEIASGRLVRVSPKGKIEVVAELGGGPNGAAIGPDGACYVCNNGGFEWHKTEDGMLLPGDQPSDYSGGKIQKVNLETGAFETLYSSVGGNLLRGPNDLVFDGKGGFWFTDLGKSRPREVDRGGLYYAKADGSMIKEVVFPILMGNGCGLSPDGKTIYVAESIGARLVAYDIVGEGEVAPAEGLFPGRLVASPGGDSFFDSMAVEADGSICIATPIKGGITRITRNGRTIEHTPIDDFLTTNICFGGPDMKTAYATLSGRGELVAIDWPRAGLKLHHAA